MELREIEADLSAKSKELRDVHSALQVLRGEIALLKGASQTNKREIDLVKEELRRGGSASQTKFTIEDIFVDYRLSAEIKRQMADAQFSQQEKIKNLEDSLYGFRADIQNMREELSRASSISSAPQTKFTIEDIFVDYRLSAEIKRQIADAQFSQQESIKTVQDGLYGLQADVRSIREDQKTKNPQDDLYYIRADLQTIRKDQGQIMTLQDELYILRSDVQNLRKDQPRIPQEELYSLRAEVHNLRKEWSDAARDHLGVTDGYFFETKVPDEVCKSVGAYSGQIRATEDGLTVVKEHQHQLRSELRALEAKMSMKKGGDEGILPGRVQDQMKIFQDELYTLRADNQSLRKEWSTAVRQHLGVQEGYFSSDTNAPDVVCKTVGTNDGRIRSAEDELSAVRLQQSELRGEVKALEAKVSMKRGGDDGILSGRVQDQMKTFQDELYILRTDVQTLRKDQPKSSQDEILSLRADVEKLRKEWSAAAHEHLGVKEGGYFSNTNVPGEVCRTITSRDGRIRSAEDGLSAVKAQQSEMRGELKAIEAKMNKKKGGDDDGSATRLQGQMKTLQDEVNVLRSDLQNRSKAEDVEERLTGLETLTRSWVADAEPERTGERTFLPSFASLTTSRRGRSQPPEKKRGLGEDAFKGLKVDADLQKLRKEWSTAVNAHIGDKDGYIIETHPADAVCKSVGIHSGQIRAAEDDLGVVKTQQNELRGEIRALETKMNMKKGDNDDALVANLQEQVKHMQKNFQDELSGVRGDLQHLRKEWSVAANTHLGAKDGYIFETQPADVVCKSVGAYGGQIRAAEDGLSTMKMHQNELRNEVKALEAKVNQKKINDDDALAARYQEQMKNMHKSFQEELAAVVGDLQNLRKEWSTATNKHLGAKDGYFYDTHPADVVCKSVGAYGGQIRAAEDGLSTMKMHQNELRNEVKALEAKMNHKKINDDDALAARYQEQMKNMHKSFQEELAAVVGDLQNLRKEWSTATNKHLGAKDGYFYDTHPADVVCKSVGAYSGQIRAAEDGLSTMKMQQSELRNEVKALEAKMNQKKSNDYDALAARYQDELSAVRGELQSLRKEWSTAANKHLGAKDSYFYETHPADVVCKSVGAYGGQIRAAEDGLSTVKTQQSELRNEVKALEAKMNQKKSNNDDALAARYQEQVKNMQKSYQDELSAVRSELQNLRKEWSTAANKHLGAKDSYFYETHPADVVCKSVGAHGGQIRAAEDGLSTVKTQQSELRNEVKALEAKMNQKKSNNDDALAARYQEQVKGVQDELAGVRGDLQKLRKEWSTAAHKHLGTNESYFYDTSVPEVVCKNISTQGGQIRSAEDRLGTTRNQQNELRNEVKALEAKLNKKNDDVLATRLQELAEKTQTHETSLATERQERLKSSKDGLNAMNELRSEVKALEDKLGKKKDDDGLAARIQELTAKTQTLEGTVDKERQERQQTSKEWSMAVRDHLGVKEGYFFDTNVPAEVCKNVSSRDGRIRSTEDGLSAVKAEVKAIEAKLNKKKDDDNLAARVQELTDKTRAMETTLERERRERLQTSKDEAAARQGQDDSLRNQLNAIKGELANLVRDQHRQDNEIGACVKADKEHAKRLDALEKRLAELEAMMRSPWPEEPERTSAEKPFFPSLNFSFKRPEHARSQPPEKPAQQYGEERLDRIHPDLTRSQ